MIFERKKCIVCLIVINQLLTTLKSLSLDKTGRPFPENRLPFADREDAVTKCRQPPSKGMWVSRTGSLYKN